MTYFPLWKDGDQRIIGRHASPPKGDDKDVSSAEPTSKVDGDAEVYDFENDERFKFENGTVSVVDIIGCRVMKDFMVN